MFSKLAVAVAAFQAYQVLAAPTPTEPFSASVFREGGECTIKWDADPTGAWTTMNIELMTGPNIGMVHLRTVATVDATTETEYSYPCLAVEPNSQIYFYQFTSPASTEVLWTTRFTIADATGQTTPPAEQETSATGEIIRYGTGTLEDPSLIDTPPSRGTESGASSGTVTRTATTEAEEETVTRTSGSISRAVASARSSTTTASASETTSAGSGAVPTASLSSPITLLITAFLGSLLL